MDRKKFIVNSIVAATGVFFIPGIITLDDKDRSLLTGYGKPAPFTTIRIGILYENPGIDFSKPDEWANSIGLTDPLSIEITHNACEKSFIGKLSYIDDITVLIGSCYRSGIEYENNKNETVIHYGSPSKNYPW